MRQGPTAQNGIENWNALVCFAPALRGVRLENGNYPTLRLYFVQQWRRMRDQQFINRDSFLLKRLNGSFYINRIPECYRRRM